MTSTLVIFDCDGVLVDSEILGNVVFAESLGQYGHEITATESAKRFRGMKLATILEILEVETSIQLPRTFTADLRRKMHERFRAELKTLPDVPNLIESMTTSFCVASSGPRSKIETSLKKTELLPHFVNKIFSAYELNSWKPDPDLFLHAAAHFGIAPENCVVVEDSYPGVQAGLAANMQVFALDSFDTIDQLSGAHEVFSSISELHDHFASCGWARNK